MNSPLVGVWELTAEPFNGLMIFTETHECHLFNLPNRQPFAKPGEPTDAEAAAAFRQCAELPPMWAREIQSDYKKRGGSQ